MEQQKDNQQNKFSGRGKPIVSAPLHQSSDMTFVGQSVTRPPAMNPMALHGDVDESKGLGYVIRKSEKLTTALYLVTDIMSEKEPMKWKARESAVDLLSDITIASALSTSEKMTMLRNVMKRVEKLVAFLDIARSAHLISEMNASVLKREYLALKDSIEGEWSHVYEKSKSLFSDSFFDVPRDPAPTLPRINPALPVLELNTDTGESRKHQEILPPPAVHTKFPDQVKTETGSTFGVNLSDRSFRGSSANSVVGQHTSTTNMNDRSPAPTSVSNKPSEVTLPMITAKRELSVANAVSGVNHADSRMSQQNFVAKTPTRSNVSESPQKPVEGAIAQTFVTRAQNEVKVANRVMNQDGSRSSTENGVDRDDRRKIILALIRQKPSLTVKDIARSISHVSEKTIQRELFAMVAEGTLMKKGERRWSTYSLR